MYQAPSIPQQSMQQPGTANPSAPLPPQVPPGWAAHWDQSQQNFYFHNSMTGTVTWDYPRQNSLPTSPPGNVHYPPQQQQIQGFGPAVTPASQYQQHYQHPAKISIIDPTAVRQPQPQQHQQQQPQPQMHHQQETQLQTQQQVQPDHLPPQTQAPQSHLEHRGEEYGGEGSGGEGSGGEEDGGEEDGSEGHNEYAGGGGLDYTGARLANDLYMKGLMNASQLI